MAARKSELSGAIATILIPVCAFSILPSKSKEAVKMQLKGSVDFQASALAAAGIQMDSTKLPAKVYRVLLGTPAHYGGLQEGDKITKLEIGENTLGVWFSRNGNNYFLKLQTPQGAKLDKVVLPGKAETAAPPKRDVQPPAPKTIEAYEVVFLIDKSTSMNDQEASVGCTRWEWCEKQICSFSSLDLKDPAKTFTVCLFNESHQIEKNCNLEKLKQIFRTNSPGGNTNIGTPLKEILDEYLNGTRKKPLLIVVMTDGAPNQGDDVEQVIIDATQKISSDHDIRITFLEIGEEFQGSVILQNLDTQLIPRGAKYDIVNRTPFLQLINRGLKPALEEALK